MISKKLTKQAREVLILLAKQEATHVLATEVLPEHVALAILKKGPTKITRILKQCQIKIASVLPLFEELIDRPTQETQLKANRKEPLSIGFSPAIHVMLRTAELEAMRMHADFIQEEHLFLAILLDVESSLHQCISKFGMTCDEFRSILYKITPSSLQEDSNINHANNHDNEEPPLLHVPDNSSFHKICINLNQHVSKEKKCGITGRDQELLQIIQILKRHTKNNPLLLGPAGVGKTAIIEALAHQINQQITPPFLHNTQIYELKISSLLAGTRYRGDFEERISDIITICENHPHIILFIDEIHLIAGAGASQDSNLDVANILKPALARGKIRCIGATTHNEYQQYLQSDSALERRFQRINIAEPNDKAMLHILEHAKDIYEASHFVSYSTIILQQIIELSKIHFPNRFMPDKALDLMDEVGATKSLTPYRLKAKLANTQQMLEHLYAKIEVEDSVDNQTPQLELYNHTRQEYDLLIEQWQQMQSSSEIAQITIQDLFVTISDKLKINSKLFNDDEEQVKSLLLNTLRQSVVGHDQIIKSLITHYIEAFRRPYFQPKPLLSLLLVGPPQVGRRCLMNALTMFSHQDSQSFLYINLSLLTSAHTVADLFSEVQQEHSRLHNRINIIQALKEHPQLVLYLDNIEMAHPDFFSYLKDMLNKAQITSSSGKTYHLYNTIIVLSSSLSHQQQPASFHVDVNPETPQDSQSLLALNRLLIPYLQEDLSHLVDHSYVFHALSHTDLLELFHKNWKHLETTLYTIGQVHIQYHEDLPSILLKESLYQAGYFQRLFEQSIKQTLLHQIHQPTFSSHRDLTLLVHYDPIAQALIVEHKTGISICQKA
ncbi:AAA family ATPase [Entomospira entomophila]|uniref:ATP-dependent Clp protease ATP-binding subunit n=1 Tax=Entomospira entomophila TaxID=2719988 RepID=A0A968G8L6_9SPIO|nr:AAA family ATPase [Entomospira entomophilus]NIZ39937.1 ATP-dependent Clp protease ATP-binding subunit [Entomospira entomophilus]WDI35498.1 AAA family ATPase [Entomospira entomophilus]